jgi:hypothetical protein
LFHNLILVKEFESYDELEKREELKNIEKVKRKFQILNFFSKFYNIIMDIRSSVNRTAEFLILATRIISFNNRTK